MRMAGARQVIGAQLVAHDEQDIFDLAHEVLIRRPRPRRPI
jgi:hypothetical protein